MPVPDIERTILHVDANCFFVSCHLAREPGLAGRPVAVAGDPSRRAGIVLSASYEARRSGVRTAMPLAEALRLCPALRVLQPDFALYRERSARLLGLLNEFTPCVEPFSIDEAWLDLTGCQRSAGGGAAAAFTIRRRLEEELHLPASIGISENKLLAKMASGLRKPRGITPLRRADVPLLLWPLPVGDLFGVGPALAARLGAWNVRTIGDLAALGPAFCERRLGQTGRRLWAAAHGRDDSAVDAEAGGDPKSVGCAETLGQDIRTPADARPVLLRLAERVARRLRERGLVAGAVVVALRDSQFRDSSRSGLLTSPTDLGPDLFRTAQALALPRLDGRVGYRLLRITAARLQPAAAVIGQPSLFDPLGAAAALERRRALARAGDAVRERFGDAALVPALLAPQPSRHPQPRRAG